MPVGLFGGWSVGGAGSNLYALMLSQRRLAGR